MAYLAPRSESSARRPKIAVRARYDSLRVPRRPLAGYLQPKLTGDDTIGGDSSELAPTSLGKPDRVVGAICYPDRKSLDQGLVRSRYRVLRNWAGTMRPERIVRRAGYRPNIRARTGATWCCQHKARYDHVGV